MSLIANLRGRPPLGCAMPPPEHRILMIDRSFLALTGLVLCLVSSTAFACGGGLHIELEHGGVYGLDYAAIVAAEPALAGCAGDRLGLSSQGREVPLRVVDDGDGILGAGDRIEWVGHPLRGKEGRYNAYSVNNVYLLRVGAGTHARVSDARPEGGAVASLERTLHYEQENLMIRLDQNQQKPGDEPDVWQWAKLTHADAAPVEFGFDLPDLGGGGDVYMKLAFRGLSQVPLYTGRKLPADHVVRVSVNGHPAFPLEWTGRAEQTHDVALPASQFKPRGNVISLSVPKRHAPWDDKNPLVDVVMFNWAEFRFGIDGDLDAGLLPFEVATHAGKPFDAAWRGQEDLAIFGDDGIRRPAERTGDGRLRFAGAPTGVELSPAVEGRLGAPVLVRALAPGRWKDSTEGFDYLIVTHPSLREAIMPLARFHEQRGLKVAVIDVDSVYDEFNDGIPHPQAIRNLVDHARTSWPAPKPRFLLLVGDASFDIRNTKADDLRYAKFANNMHELAYSGHFAGIPATQYKEGSLGFARRNLIPTWQYPSPEGQSASDNPFGTIGDDYFPVVAVGRFPVVEPAEVKAIVDKTIDYMSRPRPGQWRRDVMFITDESDYFKQASDQLADTLSRDGFVAGKIYASKDEADNLAHQSAIKQGLNDGQLLVHFVGHGGRYIWRTGPPDIRKNHDLFTLDDVSALSNSGRLPMILSMTCYSAPFDNPTEDSIGERFLREADKGAVAVFAASWRNAPSTEFSKRLVTELLTPGATIGEAIVRAKKDLNDRTLVEMYNLLGDPAVVLERPRVAANVVFDDDRWNPGVFVALPQDAFEGEVFVDWLDASGQPVQRAHVAVAGNRFRLPLPRATTAQPIAGVHIFASSSSGGEDAAARIEFPRTTSARDDEAKSASASIRKAPRPALAPGDAISNQGFETDEIRPLAALD